MSPDDYKEIRRKIRASEHRYDGDTTADEVLDVVRDLVDRLEKAERGATAK